MRHVHKRRALPLLLSLMLPFLPTANAQVPSHVPPKPHASAARTVTLTDSSNGHSVSLHPGDILLVRLAAHMDGGYTWHVVWAAAQDLLALQSDSYTPPHLKPGMVGGVGTRTFRFQVRPTGQSNAQLAEWLRFVELRPFEKGVTTPNLFQVHITVKPK